MHSPSMSNSYIPWLFTIGAGGGDGGKISGRAFTCTSLQPPLGGRKGGGGQPARNRGFARLLVAHLADASPLHISAHQLRWSTSAIVHCLG